MTCIRFRLGKRGYMLTCDVRPNGCKAELFEGRWLHRGRIWSEYFLSQGDALNYAMGLPIGFIRRVGDGDVEWLYEVAQKDED